MNNIKKPLLFICLFVSFSAMSFSSDKLLERNEVAAFIGSGEVLHDLSEEMKVSGVRTFYNFDRTLMAKKNMPIFFENVRLMQENSPEFYDRFTRIVTNYVHDGGNDSVYRFKSANDWAQIGDRIMLAYFTEHSTASRKAYDDFKASIPPGMLKLLKPEDRVKVEEQLGLLKSAQDVPEEDKKLVDSFKVKLKTVLLEMDYKS